MIKKFTKMLTVLMCVVFLTSCSNSVPQTDSNNQLTVSTELDVSSSVSLVTSDMLTYEEDDYYVDWENENPSFIELKGSSASVNGSGAEVNGSEITITSAGIYVISGKLDNGQIIVDVQDEETVKLVLNGMEINCSDSSPIYVKNAKKTIITLQDGTNNFVSDGANYVFTDTETDEPNATIFSKDNLTINGTGILNVRAQYKDGITSKDDLRITGGNILVHSIDDGLVGRDMVIIKEGNINIEAGGDGIKSTNDSDTSNGFVAIEGGTFDIISGADAIQAITSILISGGEFTITSGGGSINGSVKSEAMKQNPRNEQENNTTIEQKNSTTIESVDTESQSAKGIKATADITISGGTFAIDSSDDAIHSNNSLNITGGDISIISGDDGLHADASISINGGKINITKSYEGIESALVTITDGNISVVASDDGINVAGGNDGSSIDGRPGQNTFSSSGDNKLSISGGYISVDSAGDGLDANGSMYITNGTVIVSGPTNNGNGALDYDGTFEMSGGLLVATGSAGMAQAPSEASLQYSVIMNYSNIQQAGTLIHLEDLNGNTVATFAPNKEYQSVVICSPELKNDTAYTLYTGGTSTGSIADGLYTDGVYQDGTNLVDFTISNNVTWLSEAGVTTSGGSNPGGPKKQGMGEKPDRPNKEGY